MKGVTMPKPKKTKPNVNQYILDYEPCGRDEAEIHQDLKASGENHSYEGYEPCGRDLAEMLQDEKNYKEDPDYDPEDHWISIQTDIARGK